MRRVKGLCRGIEKGLGLERMLRLKNFEKGAGGKEKSKKRNGNMRGSENA